MSVANRILLAAAILIGLVGLTGCGSSGSAPSYSPTPEIARSGQEPREISQAYQLGGGDRLRVIVFGEDDLSGEFVVDGDGNVALPLVGEVRAGGLTLREFEQEAVAAFSERYLRNPQVSVEVLNFRPFYIIGEVKDGGEYPYTQGMTVLNAIAVAGGYSYRADRSRVFITREGTQSEVVRTVDQGVVVLPGDIIRVPERFF